MATTHVLDAQPPDLTTADAERIAHDRFGVDGSARPLVSERDQNFAIAADDGSAWVLKVSNRAEDPAVIDMEVRAVEHVARIDPSLPVPLARRSADGAPITRVDVSGTEHLVRLIPLLPGRTADPTGLDPAGLRGIGEAVARLALALRGFFHPAAGRSIWWDQKELPALMPHAELVADPDRRRLLETVLDRFRASVVPALPTLRAQVIHNDVTLDNLLLDADGSVSGIIDFGDMAHTALVLDVPATIQSLVRDRRDIFEVAAAFLSGYTALLPLEEAERELLGDLLAGRMAQTILISEVRTRQYPDNAYIRGWSEPAWQLLRQLEEVGWDVASRRLAGAARSVPVMRSTPVAAPGEDELIARRTRVLGSALEPLTYRRPLHLVRGEGAWMYDTAGRGYLDAYNNVPVVGHAHPRVVDAIARQAATLNTNTRYLHEHVVTLAERLVATMPDGLDTVLFVNSGSEANDLAWRLATTVTGGDTGIVSDWGYHGVTHAIADFSPSEWPNGSQPDAAEPYPAPNTYRGPYADAADAESVGRNEMLRAVERLTERGRRPAALFVDSTFTADGIFVPAPGVVAALIGTARDAGALLIADEVQSGYGRTGELWGFSRWGVTPDIVTLGKPMGNGHPIAAVVTRSEIVDRFGATTTFFSTFGGNPVACAAALAVLDVIEDEGLVAHAGTVGTRLRSELERLVDRHPAIGDVRGRGLMTGVELIGDVESREADRELASRVREAMRERGVLIGTTGRAGNTLKIRPPLAIRPAEATLIVEALDAALTDAGR
ncbi:MAG: aminotransferase class III-fold pyridoxal phosphate-dependent enzyme [Chloroflexi bacterium]|nr:aminotransferase class III-fold pyridoxal phosphate-dependent enzyme [Chloroflexota bacterium]